VQNPSPSSPLARDAEEYKVHPAELLLLEVERARRGVQRASDLTREVVKQRLPVP